MVNTKQVSTSNIQKIKGKEYTTTENCQITKEESKKEGLKELQNNLQKLISQITISQMRIISSHLYIITLNVNGLNPPMKRHRVAQQIKTKTKQNK